MHFDHLCNLWCLHIFTLSLALQLAVMNGEVVQYKLIANKTASGFLHLEICTS